MPGVARAGRGLARRSPARVAARLAGWTVSGRAVRGSPRLPGVRRANSVAASRKIAAALDRRRTPQARLKGLIRTLVDQRELAARYGCPFGTLACELDKRTNGLDRTAAEVMGVLADWAERQFRSMGRADARDLAIALIASYEGISLLTNTFRDPGLMAREGRRLERWVDSLAGTA